MSRRSRVAGAVAFAVTMGLFEAALVVYLRRLWEIGEIDLTSASLSNGLIRAEVLREVASLAMIASVAFLAGRRAVERFAFGALIFGVWDLLYYLDLRLLMGWPTGLLDTDVLFLIPRPWIGPVLAPVLVSLALVSVGSFVIVQEGAGRPFRVTPGAWIAAVTGGCLVITSFLLPEVPLSARDVPEGFSWSLFSTGLLLAVGGFVLAVFRGESSGRLHASGGSRRSTGGTIPVSSNRDDSHSSHLRLLAPACEESSSTRRARPSTPNRCAPHRPQPRPGLPGQSR